MTERPFVKVNMNNAKPLYLQIKEFFLSEIEKGTYKIGDKIQGEEEISSQLKVSTGIVRKAILELVDEGILIRRPRLGTSVAKLPSETFIKQKTKTIGVVFTNFQGQYMSNVLDGINLRSSQDDYHLIVCNSNHSPQNESKYIDELIERNVDGVIVFPTAVPRAGRPLTSHYKKLNRLNIPFVLIDRYFPSYKTDCVVYNDYNATKEIVKNAINLGHKKIGMISREIYASTAIDRKKGYKDALLESGIDYNPNIVVNHEKYSMPSIIDIFINEKVTCIFTLTDHFAFNLILALKKRNYSIPKDFSIISFGINEGTELLDPPIYGVVMHSTLMGKRAAEILINKISNPSTQTLHEILPYEISNGFSVKDLR